MSDDLSNRGPRDASRINLSEKWEVDYWTKKFKVSEDDLRRAVEAVGSTAEQVQKHLSQRSR